MQLKSPQRLAFQCRYPEPASVLRPASPPALLGAAALAIGLTLWWLRIDTISDASVDAGNLATVLAEQTDRSIESIDLMLSEIDGRLENLGANRPKVFATFTQRKEYYDHLVERMRHLSQITVIALADDQGRLLVTTSRWPLSGVSIADREIFPVRAQPRRSLDLC